MKVSFKPLTARVELSCLRLARNLVPKSRRTAVPLDWRLLQLLQCLWLLGGDVPQLNSNSQCLLFLWSHITDINKSVIMFTTLFPGAARLEQRCEAFALESRLIYGIAPASAALCSQKGRQALTDELQLATANPRSEVLTRNGLLSAIRWPRVV